jgi:hypothetical protein
MKFLGSNLGALRLLQVLERGRRPDPAVAFLLEVARRAGRPDRVVLPGRHGDLERHLVSKNGRGQE